jgi:tetratricopeptide (TPR) repeat protein
VRSLYLTGLTYAAVCGVIALGAMNRPKAVIPQPVLRPVETASTGDQWFQRNKPFCNAVEIETRMRQDPPAAGKEGAGYAAACFALAGRVDQARELILALPGTERGYAAWIVFNIGHPVADAGDDRSAGPIMELVLQFWPDNYMALYHAGMSEYALGQTGQARNRLHQFLELYHQNDGWRQNAVDVLARLEGVER